MARLRHARRPTHRHAAAQLCSFPCARWSLPLAVSLVVCGGGTWLLTGLFAAPRAAPRTAPRGRVTARQAANLGDIMGAMPKMMEGMKKLPELQKKLKTMPAVGTALDGRVRVTLTGDLVPADVQIDDTLLSEVSAEELSQGVLTAMKEAHAASVELTRTKLADFYGSMGVPVPPAMSGGVQADTPVLPETKKEESDLAFDPIGIGKSTLRTLD
mmetsp:Transcript_97611/g.226316  ORF Transcript_97611/g.226316 Transcript_97611/m.226316 type:complete len:214 (-) Transcript_97611:102-743(-)